MNKFLGEFKETIIDIFDEIKRKPSRVIITLVSVILLVLSLLTIWEISNSNDLNSEYSILNNEKVQYELRLNEKRFRELLTKESFNSPKVLNFEMIDSLAKNENEKAIFKRYFLIQSIKTTSNKYEFSVYINKRSEISPVVIIETIKGTYSVDLEKLQEILETTKEKTINPEILINGNYVKSSYIFDKKLDKKRILIYSFVILSLFIISIFLNRISSKKSKNSILEVLEELDEDKLRLKKINNLLNEHQLTETNKDELFKLKVKISEIDNKLKKYSFENLLKSELFSELNKSERKALEIYNRSTLMLILGLLVAIIGITAFFLSLPSFDNNLDTITYIAKSLKPTVLLIFIQSISFYMLRQYRLLIIDYKYFNRDYILNAKIFSIFILLQKEKINENEKNFISVIENSIDNKSPEKNGLEKEESTEKNIIVQTIMQLLEKIK